MTHDVVRLYPDVWRIQLPLPFRLKSVNLYLIGDGDDLALFDAGMDTDAARDAFDAALKSIGVRLERIGRLFVSHVHPDHVGMSGRLGRAGARVFLMREEEPRVRFVWSREPLTSWKRRFEEHGMPLALADEAVDAVERIRPAVTIPQRFEYVRDGDVIDVGRRRLRVKWAPGHSDFLYVLIDDRNRVIFASDQLLPGITPNIGLYPECRDNPLKDFLWSLDQFEREVGYAVLRAHGEPYDGLGRRIAELRGHHRARLDGVLGRVLAGGADGAAAYEVVRYFWPDGLTPHEIRFAMVEIIAHLEYLRLDGQITLSARPGEARYKG